MDKERRILAAARDVFQERGYDGTTVSEIVRRAGVAQGTFYLYFASKKEVFFALSIALYEQMAEHVDAAYEPDRSLAERLRLITDACFLSAAENADLVRLIFFGADSLAAEVQAAVLNENPVVLKLAEMFRRDIEEGNMRDADPEITARLVVGMVKNALIEGYILGDRRDIRRLKEGLDAMLVGAITG